MAQAKLLEEFLSAVRAIHATSGGTKQLEALQQSLESLLGVTTMARRLAALVLLQPKLDENYQTVAAATWAFGGIPTV